MNALARGLWFSIGVIALTCSCVRVEWRQYRPREGQEQAVIIAWDTYGRDDLPPLVRWKEGRDLDCTTEDSKPGFRSVVGCVAGLTWSPVEVVVAWRGTELSFSETALAHELFHSAELREHVIDTAHRGPAWQPGGLVDQANTRIVAAGR